MVKSLIASTVVLALLVVIWFGTPFYTLYRVEHDLASANPKSLFQLVDKRRIINNVGARFRTKKADPNSSFMTHLTDGFIVMMLPRLIDQALQRYTTKEKVKQGASPMANVFHGTDFSKFNLKSTGIGLFSDYYLQFSGSKKPLVLRLSFIEGKWRIVDVSSFGL